MSNAKYRRPTSTRAKTGVESAEMTKQLRKARPLGKRKYAELYAQAAKILDQHEHQGMSLQTLAVRYEVSLSVVKTAIRKARIERAAGG